MPLQQVNPSGPRKKKSKLENFAQVLGIANTAAGLPSKASSIIDLFK